MRRVIYEVIETGENREKANKVYAAFMLLCIVCSLILLAFKEEIALFKVMDFVTVTIFIIDYFLG